jgi:hypothetical protein
VLALNAASRRLRDANDQLASSLSAEALQAVYGPAGPDLGLSGEKPPVLREEFPVEALADVAKTIRVAHIDYQDRAEDRRQARLRRRRAERRAHPGAHPRRLHPGRDRRGGRPRPRRRQLPTRNPGDPAMTPPRQAPADGTARTKDHETDAQQQTELRRRLVRRLREGDLSDVDVRAEYDQRDYDVAEHALRAMRAEHGAGHVILSLTSVARRHRRDHDPELDAAAAELLERLEREVDGDELDDEASVR